MGRRYVRYKPEGDQASVTIAPLVLRFTAELAKAGARAAVVYHAGDEAPGIPGVEEIPLRHVRREGVRGGWRVPIGLSRILRSDDVLLLHSGWVFSNVLAGRIARRVGVPYVLDPQGAYEPGILGRNAAFKQAWWRAWEGGLVRNARVIQMPFENQAQQIRDLGYTGAFVFVPNGVDAPAGVRWTKTNGAALLYLGRFDAEAKGLDILVRAVAELPLSKRPLVRLVGPDYRGGKERIRGLVTELGVSEWVSIEDPIEGPAKWSLLAEAAGFVHPSRWDACPRVVIEAAAVGLPLLVTPFALGRHLAERGAAIMTEPEPAALARGLRELWTNGGAEIGRRAVEVAHREFAWSAVARSYLDQMEEILGPV